LKIILTEDRNFKLNEFKPKHQGKFKNKQEIIYTKQADKDKSKRKNGLSRNHSGVELKADCNGFPEVKSFAKIKVPNKLDVFDNRD